MLVAIFISWAYNKNVIIRDRNSNKSVKECIYGTTDFEEAVEVEEFTIP